MDRDIPIDRVKRHLEPHILRWLCRCADWLESDGEWRRRGEPSDFSDDCYRWSIVMEPTDPEMRDDPEHVIDLTLDLSEAVQFGDEPETGIAFHFSMTGWGGRILGVMAPYNYTDQVWVDARDPHAVVKRWRLFEDADMSILPDLAEEALTEWAEA